MREIRKEIVIVLCIIESVARKKSATDHTLSSEGILL